MNDVNAALLKMFASDATAGGAESSAGEGGVTPGSPQALGAVDEETESGSEVRLVTAAKKSKRGSEAVVLCVV